MRIPYQRKHSRSISVSNKFRGLDKRIGVEENSFFNMTNMSGREANCISSRLPRGKIDLESAHVKSFISTDIKIDGVISENAFIVDAGDRLKAYYYDGGEFRVKVLMNTSGFTGSQNKMIASGGYLYFFPDNKYINLMDFSDKGSLGVNITLPFGANDSFFYETELSSTDEKGEAALENSGYVKLVCKKYVNDNSAKGSYISNYNFAYEFNKGDHVEVGGGGFDGLHKIAYISELYDFVVLEGYIEADVAVSDSSVTLRRNIPQMDYVTAAGNRLWGCRYGVDESGRPVNEIYASKLGDAKNWYCFEGVSTDSYAASVGVDGVFTGAVTYEGDPHFFKEDSVIRIYGSRPSDFTVITGNIRGVENGSSESAVVVDDTLYYKTYNGIVAYNGGLPYNVDDALGNEAYKNAVAGCRSGEYYVSMENSEGLHELFVYDTREKEWYREDDTRVIGFCRSGNELYMLTERNDEKTLLSVGGTGDGDAEKTVSWSLESPDIDYYIPYRKAVTKLEFKLELAEKAYIKAEICYDGESRWHKIASESGRKKRITVSVRPRRCDTFRIRFSGNGDFKLISVARAFTANGDNRGGE